MLNSDFKVLKINNDQDIWVYHVHDSSKYPCTPWGRKYKYKIRNGVTDLEPDSYKMVFQPSGRELYCNFCYERATLFFVELVRKHYDYKNMIEIWSKMKDYV